MCLIILQKDPHHSLKELAKVCILADCTLMVAFRWGSQKLKMKLSIILHWAKKPLIHQEFKHHATSKNVLSPGHNHLLTFWYWWPDFDFHPRWCLADDN